MAETTLVDQPAVNSDNSDSQMNVVDLKSNSNTRTSSPVSCCADSNVPKKQETSSSAMMVSPSDTASLSSCSHEEREHGNTGATTTTETTVAPAALVLPEESEALLRQLARQLEFYFSRFNLSKDMYLQTLRELNDGYVPVTILASFGKVQALVSYDSVNAVIQAASDYSDALQVVTIDIETRKRVDVKDAAEDAASSKKKNETLLAVGPIHKEPLDIEVEATPVSITPFVSPTRVVTLTPITPSSQTSTDGAFQNTIIIRDVPSDVTEEQVRALFDAAVCPPILNVHLDVASCWFVSFDTTSREDMINIMISLKSKQLPNGDSVKARLKAAPAATVTAGAPLLPMMLPGFDGVAATGYFPNLGFSSDDAPSSPRSQSRRQNGKRGRKSSKTAKQQPPASSNSSSTGTASNNNSSNNSKASSSQKSNRVRGSKQKKASTATTTPDAEQQRVPSSTASSSSVASSEPAGTVQLPPEPPVLADDQFPALGDVVLVNTDEMKAADAEHAEAGQQVVLEDTPSKNNSVAGDDYEDDERKFKNMSDAASTATTTSSSSSSIPKAKIVIGAYAAALLKSPPAVPPAKPVPVATKTSEAATPKKQGDNAKNRSATNKLERKDSSGSSRMESEKAKRDASREVKKEEEVKSVPPAPVVITPPTWGRGRSFADVLRKPESGELVTSS